jgi:hypothetical protein
MPAMDTPGRQVVRACDPYYTQHYRGAFEKLKDAGEGEKKPLVQGVLRSGPDARQCGSCPLWMRLGGTAVRVTRGPNSALPGA